MRRVISTSYIAGAEGSSDTVADKLNDSIGRLKDDFDYILSGLEYMGRQGANGSNEALMIVENLNAEFAQFIEEIAHKSGSIE